MSLSPPTTNPAKPNEAYERGWVEMGRKVLQGRSWSGRERHCAFLNTGGPRFATVSHVSGIDLPEDGRGMAVVDWDHDGDQDLWISHRTAPRIRFMRNESPGGHHHVALRLQSPTANRDAIGARVRLFAVGAAGGHELPQIQTLRAGEGFLSQSSKWLSFGLGKAGGLDRVEVHWPDGKQEVFRGLEVDRRYVLLQGSGVAKATPLRPPVALQPAPLKLPDPTAAARTFLAAPVPAPPLTWRDAAGVEQRLIHKPGQTTLISLWSRWCKACVAEFREFGSRAGELDKAGLRVIALNVDELSGKGKASQAAALLRSLGLKGDSGVAGKNLVTRLEMMHRMLLAHRRDLPLPTSFLIDDRGWLRAIYKGRVAVDTLLADQAALSGEPAQLRANSSPFKGSWYSPHPLAPHANIALSMLKEGMLEHARALYQAAAVDDDHDEFVHNNLAMLLLQIGRNDEAEVHLNKAVAIDPKYAEPLTNLGNLRMAAGRAEEAVAFYERALESAPEHPIIHNSYGIALAELGWLAKAREAFATALRLKPDYALARDNLQRATAALANAGAGAAPSAP